MIRKKLIEVALPLAEINDAAAYDKMPGIGPHPKGIHHWWARLPLPAARAFLFASVVDDPSSDPRFSGGSEESQAAERDRLFGIMRGLLQKKINDHPEAYEHALEEMNRCTGGSLPPVLDPFCGGGSIPLEAMRMGFEATAGDLNPVAVLITKALIELAPRFAGRLPVNPEARRGLELSGSWNGTRGLADDIRYYGERVLEIARDSLRPLYPQARLPKASGGKSARPIAWLWARTVKCSNPSCGAMMPLVKSFSLATKQGRRISIQPVVDVQKKTVSFAISPAGETPSGTISRTGARCVVCKQAVGLDHIRREAQAGRMQAQMMAMVLEIPRGRTYLPPSEEQVAAAALARPENGPTTEIPERALGFRVRPYGFVKHSDFFTPRQLQALICISDAVREVHSKVVADTASCMTPAGRDGSLGDGDDGAKAYADAVTTFLAFAIDRLADFNCALSTWKASGEQQMHLFGRAVVPMVWDFCEGNVLGEKGICWRNAVSITADAVETITVGNRRRGHARQADAAKIPPSPRALLVSTDPPYYDNMGYADLSDFFYVWLRRTIGPLNPELFRTVLVPKSDELVASPERFANDKQKAKAHFEDGFSEAFSRIKLVSDPRFPMTVYYAFKQSDEEVEDRDSDNSTEPTINLTTGWETLLAALVSTGFQVTGTWPVWASQKWRLRAMGSNALASYIVLACRPRPDDTPTVTRADFRRFLRVELPAALKALQLGNIAPVDMAQASIGPGMAIYSRYAKVLEADGTSMTVRTALQLINQALDEFLGEQEAEFDSDTRLALTWFETFAYENGPFGDAETLAKARGVAVSGVAAAGILSSAAGKVRLRRRDELPDDWNPETDKRLTVWEAAQHLIKRLETKGEQAAGELLAHLRSHAAPARDLAYRLYTTCERKGWAEEGRSYNGLVVAWPELERVAASSKTTVVTQENLF